MNAHRHPIASLLLTAIASLAVHSHACAQTPLTRAEVIADYQEAVHTGDVLAPGDSGQKLNERFPELYPKPPAAAAAIRDQVVAELQAATRRGDVLAPGDSGMKLNERSPGRYPTTATAIGKTRDEVRTETLEAIRTGDVPAPGDSGLKLNEISRNGMPGRRASRRATSRWRLRSDRSGRRIAAGVLHPVRREAGRAASEA